jgi:hypothetical protein
MSVLFTRLVKSARPRPPTPIIPKTTLLLAAILLAWDKTVSVVAAPIELFIKSRRFNDFMFFSSFHFHKKVWSKKMITKQLKKRK